MTGDDSRSCYTQSPQFALMARRKTIARPSETPLDRASHPTAFECDPTRPWNDAAHGHEKVLTGGQFESSIFGQINDITFPLTIHHLGPPVGDGVGANQHHTNRGDTTIEVSEGTYGRDRRLSRSWKLSGSSSSL